MFGKFQISLAIFKIWIEFIASLFYDVEQECWGM